MLKPLISVIMGSRSDFDTMHSTETLLLLFGIPYEMQIISAHRTPERMYEYAKGVMPRGIEVVIAGAGCAAHLPGMVASLTYLPVIGVPILSSALNGVDSLLSIAQMPAGTPVNTMAIGKAGAVNAAIMAATIVGIKHPEYFEKVKAYRDDLTKNVPLYP